MRKLFHLLPGKQGAWRGLLLGLLALAGCTSADDASPAPTEIAAGQAGAVTRFVVQGSRLYAIGSQKLQVYDISGTVTASTYGPARWQQTITLGTNIQALYPAGNRLFASLPAGLLLLDPTTQSSPVNNLVPATGCDPVVSDGRWAYVLMPNDRVCGGGNNQLQVVDLSDPLRPNPVQNYPLSRPQGISLLADSAQLFVCDNGLKVYTTRQAPTLTLLDQLSVEALDVQAADGLLLVTSSEALTQYRYANRSLQFLSSFPITRP